MDEGMKTRAIERIEGQMERLEPGTVRHRTLQAARQFKESWIHLGQMLYAVHQDKHYKAWGYQTFDAYCSKEVGIRAGTAKKLLHSYYFLENKEPQVLSRLQEESPSTQVPPAESVNLLRLLEKKHQNQEVSEESYNQVRRYVLDRAPEPQEVRQQMREVMEEDEPVRSEAAEAKRQATAVKRMVTTLKSTRLVLKQADWIPEDAVKDVDALIVKLESILPE